MISARTLYLGIPAAIGGGEGREDFYREMGGGRGGGGSLERGEVYYTGRGAPA